MAELLFITNPPAGFRQSAAGVVVLGAGDRVLDLAPVGATTVQLPDPTLWDPATAVLITKTNTNADGITLVRFAAEQINAIAANFLLPGSNTAAILGWLVRSNGANWFVV